MKSLIRLERTIALQEWRISGTVAVATKREWEPALLKLAEEHEWLTPEVVVQQLLGGRQGVARRLLDICTGLRLLEARREGWRATEAGRLAAATGLVLLPDRGVWTLWTAEDPLLPHAVVAVSPWRDEPSAYDERGKDVSRVFKALPAAITGAVGKVLDVPAGPLRAIRIDDLGESPRGERVDSTAKMRITWMVGPNETRCRLKGSVGDKLVDTDVPAPKWTHERVWQSLLRCSGLESRWDPQARVLRIPFKETTDEERSRMARALRVASPRLEGLGDPFEDTTVDPVGLHARSPEDATLWARWRFFRALTTYATDGAIQKAYRQAAEPFEGLAASCPSRAELVRLARGDGRPPPAFWWLQAPADWSLEKRSPQ